MKNFTIDTAVLDETVKDLAERTHLVLEQRKYEPNYMYDARQSRQTECTQKLLELGQQLLAERMRAEIWN